MSSTIREVIAVSKSGREVDVASKSEDPLIAGLNGIAAGWKQLADLELSGRAMVTFMRGHMAEAVRTSERSEHAEGGGGSGRASEPRGAKAPRE